jgi:hypothetical protein
MNENELKNYRKRDARWVCLLAMYTDRSGCHRRTLETCFKQMRYTDIELVPLMSDLCR